MKTPNLSGFLSRLSLSLILLLTVQFSFAQKNNPVAGDAAQLIDFLKKDYSTISPEKREFEIMRDRAKVITIFKSYLTKSQSEKLGNNEEFKKSKKIEALNDYKKTLELSRDDSVKTLEGLIPTPYRLASMEELITDYYLESDRYFEEYEDDYEKQKKTSDSILNLSQLDVLIKDNSADSEKLSRVREHVYEVFEEIEGIETQIFLAEFGSELINCESTDISIIAKKLSEALSVYNREKRKLDLFKSINSDQITSEEYTGLINRFSTSVDTMLARQYKYDNVVLSRMLCIFENEEEYQNIFIRESLDKFILKFNQNEDGVPDTYAQKGRTNTVLKSTSFLGGNLGFETLIDGVSKFLASRIKEELGVFAMEQIQSLLGQKGVQAWEDMRILFPSTTEYAASMDYFAPDFANKLKEYVQDDIRKLPDNLLDFKEIPRIDSIVQRYPALAYACEGLDIISQLSGISDPLDYFNIIASSSLVNNWSNLDKLSNLENSPWQYNVAQSIRLTQLFMNSLTVLDGGKQRFVDMDVVGEYFSEIEFQHLYFAFLKQQDLKYYNISFWYNSDKVILSKLMDERIGEYNLYKERYELNRMIAKDFLERAVNLSDMTQVVEKRASEIRKNSKTEDKVDPKLIHEFVESIIDLGEEATMLGESFVSELISLNSDDFFDPEYLRDRLAFHKKTKPYWELGRSSNEIFLNLAEEEYSLAIVKALKIMSAIRKDTMPSTIDELLVTIEGIGDFFDDKVVFRFENQLLTFIDSLNIGKGKEYLEGLKSDESAYLFGESENELFLQSIRKLNRYERINGEIESDDSLVTKNLHALYFLLRDEEYAELFGDNNSPVNEQKKDALLKLIKEDVAKIEFKELFVSNVLLLERPIGKYKQHWKNKIQSIGLTEEVPDTFVKYSNDIVTSCFSIFSLSNRNSDLFVFDEEKEKLFLNELSKLSESLEKSTSGLVLHLKKNVLAHLGKASGLDQDVIRIVHFFDELSKTEDSDGVKNALEAFAMPSGSYSVKRKSKFNVSINAYPGLLPSCEWAKVLKNGTTDEYIWKPEFSVGFTAPIGLNLSRGLGQKGGSLGVFVSVIDIGAPTTFRFNSSNDSIEALPKFTFRNIFAPGAYLSYGLPNAPISFNAGLQYGPQLRSIKVGDDQNLIESFRAGVGITVDIPIFNLHTRPYKMKNVPTKRTRSMDSRLSEYESYVKQGNSAYDKRQFDDAILEYKMAKTARNNRQIRKKIRVAKGAARKAK